MAAEHDIDLLVRETFFQPRKRFFIFPDRRQRVIVEVGAARPDYLSVSASFRTAGWKVIAIEPNPAFCELHRSRGFEVLQYACSDEDKDDVDFFVVDSHNLEYMGGTVSAESFSSLGMNPEFEALHETVRDMTTTSTIKVKVRKLDTILAQHEPQLTKIDLLAVDVEGWELSVMRGFSLQRYQPKVVILEDNFETPAYRDYMAQHGYRFWKRLAPNDIYVSDSVD